MAKSSVIEALTKISGRNPWIIIGIWTLALIIAGLSASIYLQDALSTEESFTSNIQSRRAEVLLKKYLPDANRIQETVVIRSKIKVDHPAFRDFVSKLQKEINALGTSVVKQSVSYYQTGNRALVSKNGRATVLPIIMAGTSDEAKQNIAKLHRLIETADKDGRFQVLIIGGATFDKHIKEVAEEDLRSGETYGIIAALVILTLVAGAILSALLPLVLSVAAIALAVGITAILGQFLNLSFFVTNIISMMGLAVGIDYSLFIVSRYREELARGLNTSDAIAAIGATSNRAVFFSGVTVVLALLGMLMVPHTIFRSTAIGAIVVVISAIFASLTLLPAILSILGNRINLLTIPLLSKNTNRETGGRFWLWVSRSIMRRPVLSLALALAFMIGAAAPYLNIDVGSSLNAGNSLPDGLSSKKAYTILKNEFSLWQMSQAQIVVDGQLDSPSVQRAISKLKSALKSDPAFGIPTLAQDKNGQLALLSVPVLADSEGAKAISAIKRLRGKYVPGAFREVRVKVYVGGQTAQNIDFAHFIDTYTPLVLIFVLGLSFILLTVVFRSLVVPAKAILMNLLSLGAAYGLLVLVFQEGIGAKFLGFQQTDKLEGWIPLFLFSILFGLSMDYHVFLLSRIREHYDRTGDNQGSVAFGLQTTGRIITGAALIMVAVFAGFAAGRVTVMQQLGFGLAVAVLLDATIVRSILVPAGMKLLGSRNWYLPRTLEWLPALNIEGRHKVNSLITDGSLTITHENV